MTSEGASDASLAARAAKGDRRAFAALVRSHGVLLAAVARGYGVAPGEVEDVVQDAFIAAWRGLEDYDVQRPFRAWLCQVALNKARDWRRRRRVRRFFHDASALEQAQAVETDQRSPELAAHDRRLLAKVAAEVAALPEDLRQVFVLITVGGLTYGEAAVALGQSLKAVEGRLMRARRRLDASLSGLTS